MNPRGACPTVFTPMQTGDGLLARIIPQSAVLIDAFCALCVAAEDHGNGIIEVTQRGSIQVRGLSQKSAPVFARTVGALDITTEDGPPFLTSPLLGLDPAEPFNATALVSSLRERVSEQSNLRSLGPKVSVLIDGGGALHLDALAADIRLVADGVAGFLIGIAGDAGSAIQLGYVTVGRAAEAVEQLLLQIAERGPTGRAKDLIASRGATASRDTAAALATLSGFLAKTPVSQALRVHRPPAEPLATFPLTTGTLARGFALPFGHTIANALKRFAVAAAANGATSIRPAPGRSLLAIGLSKTGVDNLCETAAAEGFIVNAQDSRRHVVACAGAPACASAELATRELAPQIASAAGALVGTLNVVHLSGCSKGCAHPGPAALTIVGPNHVVLNGRANDAPCATISSAGLMADVTKYCNELRHA